MTLRAKSGLLLAQVPQSELPEVFPKGRRCLICSAYLCMYNGNDTCWHHTPEGQGILIETGNGWQRFPLTSLISRKKLAELVPNRG